MKTEQQIKHKIEELQSLAKFWYKQNKNPNRHIKRGQCVNFRNHCLSKIKLLQWVLDDCEDEQILQKISECEVENAR